MTEVGGCDRPVLSDANAEKVAKLMQEWGMSGSEVVNRLLSSITVTEMAFAVKFSVAVDQDNSMPRRLMVKRVNIINRFP